MHMTISFTLDIYTTTFIAANYYSSDWYFEYILYATVNYMRLYTLFSCWMNAKEMISRVIHNCAHRNQNGWWKEVR